MLSKSSSLKKSKNRNISLLKNCPHVWTGPYKFTYVGCHPNTLNVVKAFANRYSSVDLSVPTIPWTRI